MSSAHRQGIDHLLEEVLAKLPDEGTQAELDSDPSRIRVAFIGRPNVGKSTLVNRLLGEERMIASEVPGTTRDSVAIDMERDGRLYRLIDTAGLRRKSRVEEAVEKFSIIKTLQAIEQCQVAVVMLDAGEGVTDQDASVLGYALDAGRALVVAVNKWDGQTDYQRQQTEGLLVRKLAFVDWAEAVRISAKHGSGLRELFKAVHRAHDSATRELPPPKSPRPWKSPTRPIRRRWCAVTSPSCATPTRRRAIRRPSSSTARACAPWPTATSATWKTSSASVSS